MIEQELIQIWKSSPQVEQVKFEKSRLMMDVQSSLDRFHKATKRMIFIESMTAIIVMPIFIAYVFVIPVLLSKIASAMIAIWIGYVMYVMRKMKKEHPDRFSLSYLDYLRNTRDYLIKQKRLRENIFWWYILPFISMVFLFLLGFILESAGKIDMIIKTAVFSIFIGGTTFILNRQSAKKYVKPKLEKVKKLIQTMEEES